MLCEAHGGSLPLPFKGTDAQLLKHVGLSMGHCSAHACFSHRGSYPSSISLPPPLVTINSPALLDRPGVHWHPPPLPNTGPTHLVTDCPSLSALFHTSWPGSGHLSLNPHGRSWTEHCPPCPPGRKQRVVFIAHMMEGLVLLFWFFGLTTVLMFYIHRHHNPGCKI